MAGIKHRLDAGIRSANATVKANQIGLKTNNSELIEEA
jgi:hypothetical protein